MADIPESLDWGIVEGRFGTIVSDTTDAGRVPDIVPLTGMVTLTPSEPWVRALSDPDGGMFEVETLVCPIIAGRIYPPDTSPNDVPAESGVPVLATQQANAFPNIIQWTASFDIPGTQQLRPVLFNVAGQGATTHLEEQFGDAGEVPYIVVVSDEERRRAELAAAKAGEYRDVARTEADRAEAAAEAAGALEPVVGVDGKLLPEVLPEPLTDAGLSAKIDEQVEQSPYIPQSIAAALASPGGLGILSDSISTYDQAASTTKVTRNWHGLLSVAEGRRIVRSGVFGTGGYTVEQIRDVHLPQLLASADRPAAVAICGGTNNMSTDAGMASGYAALIDIIGTLQANLIRPILWLAPPRADSALGNVLKWNARVAFLARKLGLQVVDAYTPLASITTGGIANAATDYQSGDSVHPSAVGHAKIAAYNAALPGWLDRFREAAVQLAYPADASTMMANNEGLFLSDSGHAGYGNGWVQWGTGVSSKSIVTDAAGVRWQRMSKSAGFAGQGGLQYNITSGFAAGDLVEIVARMNVGTVEALYSFGVTAYNGSTLLGSGTGGPAGMQGLAFQDGVVRARLVIPSGATTVRGEFQFNNSTPVADTYVEVAQVAIRNLTALGVS